MKSKTEDFITKQTNYNEFLQNNFEDHETKLDKNLLSIKSISKIVNQNAFELEKQEEKIKEKAIAADLAKLTERFKVFENVEHIQTLKEVFLPRIANFAKQVDQLEQSNIDQRVCIQEFDRALSLKLNKSVLPVLMEELKGTYLGIDTILTINSKFDDIWKNVKEREALVGEEIERHKGHIDDVVNKSIVENITTKFKHYDNVAKSFQQFFNQDELGSLIDRKADLELITRI